MNPDASTAHLAEGRSSVIPMPQRITQESRREAFDLAVRSLPDEFGPGSVETWLHENAGWIEDVWIEGRLAADTVNDRRRQHMPGPRDVLFGRADGRYERYDPAVPGRWSATGRPEPAGTEPATVTELLVPPASSARRRARPHLHRRAG